MREKREAYTILVGNPKVKRPVGRRRRRWEDNSKETPREVGWIYMGNINLTQDTEQWLELLSTFMIFRVS
jgi:hypothetical protein